MYKEFIIARMRLDSNGEVTMRSHAMLLFNSVEESDTFCQSEKKNFPLMKHTVHAKQCDVMRSYRPRVLNCLFGLRTKSVTLLEGHTCVINIERLTLCDIYRIFLAYAPAVHSYLGIWFRLCGCCRGTHLAGGLIVMSV